MSLFSFFFPRIIAKVNSSFNGEILVVEQFGRRSIRVAGLQQSGPMIESLWQQTIKTLNKNTRQQAKRKRKILILGLGGGSVLRALNKYYPQAKIMGVEIDPIMIDLGKRYLGLKNYQNLEIKIADAIDLNNRYYLRKFDLILVDLYLGRKVPEKAEAEEFLRNIKKLLKKGGIVIFNRLRTPKEEEFNLFSQKLQKIFANVKMVKPLINQLFICS